MREVTARCVNMGSRLRERPEVGLESTLRDRLVRGREVKHEPEDDQKRRDKIVIIQWGTCTHYSPLRGQDEPREVVDLVLEDAGLVLELR